MASFGTALGQLAQSYGKAGLINRQQTMDENELALKQAASQRAGEELGVQRDYLGLAKLREQREAKQQLTDELVKKGALLDVGGTPYVKDGTRYVTKWNAYSGKPVEVPIGQGVDPNTVVTSALTSLAKTNPKYAQMLKDSSEARLQAGEDPQKVAQDTIARLQNFQNQQVIDDRQEKSSTRMMNRQFALQERALKNQMTMADYRDKIHDENVKAKVAGSTPALLTGLSTAENALNQVEAHIGVMDSEVSKAKLLAALGQPKSAIGSYASMYLIKSLNPEEKAFYNAMKLANESIGGLRGVTGMMRPTEALMQRLLDTLPTPRTTQNSADAKARIALLRKEIATARTALGSGTVPPEYGVDGGVMSPGDSFASPQSASPAAQSDVIYARDPSGKLHRGKRGTALPAGWRLTNGPE